MLVTHPGMWYEFKLLAKIRFRFELNCVCVAPTRLPSSYLNKFVSIFHRCYLVIYP